MTGRDLRTIREACGVTMGDLADAMGWPVSAISDIERDPLGPEVTLLPALGAALAEIVRGRTPAAEIEAPGAKGECPACGRHEPLTFDGVMVQHECGVFGYCHCRGTGKPPAAEIGADVRGER